MASSSLVFLNSDPLADFPKLTSARVIDIGGISVHDGHKKLDKVVIFVISCFAGTKQFYSTGPISSIDATRQFFSPSAPGSRDTSCPLNTRILLEGRLENFPTSRLYGNMRSVIINPSWKELYQFGNLACRNPRTTSPLVSRTLLKLHGLLRRIYFVCFLLIFKLHFQL